MSYILVWRDELRSCVASQHVDDRNLTPLVDVDEQAAQLAVVLVNQVDALRTDLLERLNRAASHQLKTYTLQTHVEKRHNMVSNYHRCFVRKELLNNFDQLIFLFWINAARTSNIFPQLIRQRRIVLPYLYSLGMACAAVLRTYGDMSITESLMASIMMGTIIGTLMLDKTLKALPLIS